MTYLNIIYVLSLKSFGNIGLILFKGGGGGGGGGGVVSWWVEHATPGVEVVGLNPVLSPYWVGRCQYNGIG